ATNVVRLDKFLNLSRPDQTNRIFLLLPKNSRAPFGLFASEIVDTPTLVLQLDRHAYAADGVLGTLMIQGEIALLIDVDRIVQLWQASSFADRKALPERGANRILVVDDTQFFQKLVADHLRSAGHEVEVAGNGEAGLAAIRA